MVSAQVLLKEAGRHIGVRQGSPDHRTLVDAYNQVLPRPQGYRVRYQDDWCDIFVTAIADKVQAAGLIGRECGVHRHLSLFKQMGIWLGRVKPQPGDIIIFDWDGRGWADHIGYVEAFDGRQVVTIEGNSRQQVSRNRFVWNDWRIMGYARPRYGKSSNQPVQSRLSVTEIAKQVIQGRWGNGLDRHRRLTQAGYDYLTIQKAVNHLLLNL